MKQHLFMTVDVEDYFQVENFKEVIKYQEWDNFELRVENNINSLLDLFGNNDVKATFFILGWIAQRKPDLVKKIAAAGHEVASHGFNHELLYSMKREDLANDLLKSKKILEDLTSKPVIGYRAPSFSITEEAISILKELDFKYDSSYFNVPAHHRYSKIKSFGDHKEMIFKHDNGLMEISVTTLKILNNRLPWGGGGYFRILPYLLFKSGIKKAIKQNNGAVFYIHPWEIDCNQPVIKDIKLFYKFRHYVGLSRNLHKLEKLIKDFRFTPIELMFQQSDAGF